MMMYVVEVHAMSAKLALKVAILSNFRRTDREQIRIRINKN